MAENEHKDNDGLKHPVRLVVILFIIAIIVGILFQCGDCYESKIHDGFVEKTRIEVIIDYFNGVEYEEIHWH